MNTEIEKVDFTWTSIFKFFFVLILFYFVFLTKDILVLTLLSLIISILFNPLINILERKKLSRSLAGFIVYFSFVLILSFLFYFLIPPIVSEIQSFTVNMSKYLEVLPKTLTNAGFDLKNISSFILNVKDELVSVSSNIFGFIISIFGSIFAGITVFALALFLSIEKDDILKVIKSITPKKWEEEVVQGWERSQEKVSSWFVSRIFCSIGVTILTFLLCVFLNIKFAVSLSLFSGVLNIVPVVGPLVAGIVLAVVALFDSWNKVVLVIIASIIIQQIENNILTPFFTRKMVGIPTFLVLLSILFGGKLLGIIGAILAIPLVGIFYETTKTYFLSKKDS
jgi:predicted PurR-regulated permease PerM